MFVETTTLEGVKQLAIKKKVYHADKCQSVYPPKAEVEAAI